MIYLYLYIIITYFLGFVTITKQFYRQKKLTSYDLFILIVSPVVILPIVLIPILSIFIDFDAILITKK